MRKALVRLEQLQAEKTSLEDELAGVRRACANFERGAAEAGRRISELVAANTPLLGVVTAARLFVEAQTKLNASEHPCEGSVLDAIADEAYGDLATAVAALGKPTPPEPAVTGTTSDKNPIRKPAAGDAKGK
jgi:hypothetical protein